MKRRPSILEKLENRQLMAGDLHTALLPIDPSNSSDSHWSLTTVAQPDLLSIPIPSTFYYPAATGMITAIDGGSVFTTNHPDGQSQTLWRINSDATIAFQTALDFSVTRIIDAGDRLYLLGAKPFGGDVRIMTGMPTGHEYSQLLPYVQEMVIAAVDSASGKLLAQTSFSDGIQQLEVVGDQLLIASQAWNGYPVYLDGSRLPLQIDSNTGAAFDPQTNGFIHGFPEPKVTLSLLELSEGEFKTVSTVSAPPGTVDIRGNHILLTTITAAPEVDALFPTIWTRSVQAFVINNQEIQSVGDPLEVNGNATYIRLSDDGQSVFLFQSEDDQSISETTFTQYAFSDNGLQILSSTSLRFNTPYIAPLYLSEDLLVLQNWNDSTPQTWIVSIQNGQASYRQVESRNTYFYAYDFKRMGDELLAIGQHQGLWNELNTLTLANRVNAITDAVPVNRQTILSISFADGSYRETEISDDRLWVSDLRIIDAQSGRIGFIASSISQDGEWRTRFTYGSLKEGKFIETGSIRLPNTYSLLTTSDEIVVQSENKVLVYEYGNRDPSDRLELPLPPTPPPVAIDDHIVLYNVVDDQLLSLLATDIAYSPIRIVELIDAPPGAEIIDGMFVKLPAAVLSGDAKIEFSYVISDGTSKSVGQVTVEVVSISTEEVDALVQSVREQAAQEFQLDLDSVNVISVSPIFYNPTFSNDAFEWRNDPFYVVKLQLPEAQVSYMVNLRSEVTLLEVVPNVSQQPLVQIDLRVLGENGELAQAVKIGDKITLEIMADDLRAGGGGVFATMIDLEFPENVKLVGDIETVPPFTLLRGSELSEISVRRLGALNRSPSPPGPDSQVVFRITFEVTDSGVIRFAPKLTEGVGAETLLYGDNERIDPSRVVLTEVGLEVASETDSDPEDIDGDGNVVSLDVLHVINFLETNGTGLIENLARQMSQSSAADPPSSGTGKPYTTMLEELRRYDVTRDNAITPLDALIVINRLNRELLTTNPPNNASTNSLLVDPNSLENNPNKKKGLR